MYSLAQQYLVDRPIVIKLLKKTMQSSEKFPHLYFITKTNFRDIFWKFCFLIKIAFNLYRKKFLHHCIKNLYFRSKKQKMKYIVNSLEAECAPDIYSNSAAS
jgi:hypothetical protein